MSEFEKYIVAATIDTSQNTITAKYVLFKVTTCLYLSPSNGARRLSTHIAVSINKDTEHKVWAVIKRELTALREIFHCLFIVDIQ